MAYELFLLPVAPGADLEEAGEALLARLEGADEVAADAAADPALAALLDIVRRGDAAIGPAPTRTVSGAGVRPVPVADLRGAHGIEVTVSRAFVRFRVPFQHRGDDADAVFERLFRLLASVAAATGWLAYDPQEAIPVALDDAGRDETLEVYLTVMDQLRPGGSPAMPGRRSP